LVGDGEDAEMVGEIEGEDCEGSRSVGREFEVKLQIKGCRRYKRRRLLLCRLEIRRGMLVTGREGGHLSKV
jgi:hypothetical protein